MCPPRPLTLVMLLLTTTANGEGNHPNQALTKTAATNSPARVDIETLDGRVYKSARIPRSEPSGLNVEYSPEKGGLGLAMIKFKNLPEYLQEQYGYDERR